MFKCQVSVYDCILVHQIIFAGVSASNIIFLIDVYL